ncbi:MAG: hypothetical protein D6762_05245, partial [Candidatus Neomarinimicrobiota bacterium]
MNILLIRFSSIGDIVQSTCVLDSIKKHYPDSRLWYLTLEAFGPLLENHSRLDEILLLRRDASPRQLLHLAATLRGCNFALVFDLHRSLRSRLICSGMDPRIVYSVRKPYGKRWLLTQWHWDRFPPDWTVQSLFMEPVRRAGIVPVSDPRPRLEVSEREIRLCRRKHRLPDSYQVLVPGAAWSQKIWPASHYAEVIKARPDLQTILLGTA